MQLVRQSWGSPTLKRSGLTVGIQCKKASQHSVYLLVQLTINYYKNLSKRKHNRYNLPRTQLERSAQTPNLSSYPTSPDNLQCFTGMVYWYQQNYTVLWSAEHTYNNIIDSNNHSATISILDRFIMQSPKILLSKGTLERIRWVCSEELSLLSIVAKWTIMIVIFIITSNLFSFCQTKILNT